MIVATYNMLQGGSGRTRAHWARLIEGLGVGLLLAQESGPHDLHLPPAAYPQFRGRSVWERAGPNRWGSAIFSGTGRLTPLPVPGLGGWAVGAEIVGASWQGGGGRPAAVFSVHVPYGPGSYTGQANRLLDAIAGIAGDRDVLIGGDFNLPISPGMTLSRPPRRRELAIHERLADEFGLMNCWIEANPGQSPPQTLRWAKDRTIPYHCDGIFAPRRWRDRLRSCVVVSGGDWERLSDHNPVVAEFAGPLPRAGRKGPSGRDDQESG